MSSPRVALSHERYGPFERLVFEPLDAPRGAQHSIYRIGDVLVDTGSSRVTDAVLDSIAADPPARVLLTHQHEDHVGNLGPILDRFGPLPVHAPRELVAFLPTFERAPPYRHAYWGSPHRIPEDVLIPYDDGDTFDVRGLTLRAVATPGHTPPHHAFLAESEGRVYALTGDVYASRPFDAFLESALDDTVRSYRGLAAFGDRLVMLPTHGRVRDGAARMLTEAADFLEREASAIEETSRALGTRDACLVSEHRYGRDPFHVASGGEMGRPIFVRSVLAPVRTLPAEPLPTDRG